jgi:uncharacterized protein YbjT (DUF2867 family)
VWYYDHPGPVADAIAHRPRRELLRTGHLQREPALHLWEGNLFERHVAAAGHMATVVLRPGAYVQHDEVAIGRMLGQPRRGHEHRRGIGRSGVGGGRAGGRCLPTGGRDQGRSKQQDRPSSRTKHRE